MSEAKNSSYNKEEIIAKIRDMFSKFVIAHHKSMSDKLHSHFIDLFVAYIDLCIAHLPEKSEAELSEDYFEENMNYLANINKDYFQKTILKVEDSINKLQDNMNYFVNIVDKKFDLVYEVIDEHTNMIRKIANIDDKSPVKVHALNTNDLSNADPEILEKVSKALGKRSPVEKGK